MNRRAIEGDDPTWNVKGHSGFHGARTGVVCALLVGVAACSTATAPRAVVATPSSVSVNNPFCDSAGSCTPLGIALYPRSLLGLVSDSSRAGIWLGWVQGPAACFALPASDTIVDVVSGAAGTPDTLRYTWSTNDPKGAFLGVFAFDVAMAASHTFIPADSPGWSLAVPDSFPTNGKTFWAPVTKRGACTHGS